LGQRHYQQPDRYGDKKNADDSAANALSFGDYLTLIDRIRHGFKERFLARGV
jgi:hypothetical protein